jgi:N-acyl-L-homoserine lactone synthetase
MMPRGSTKRGETSMIELLEGIRPGESSVLDEAMRLRHHVFVEEMGWEGLRRADGRDFDQFDTPATIHQIAIVNGEVAGYHRFNATTGPHLLADVHHELCDGPSPRGSHIWEWSRYCVARKFKREGAFCDVASTLLIAALEWGEPIGIEEFCWSFIRSGSPASWSLASMSSRLGFPVSTMGTRLWPYGWATARKPISECWKCAAFKARS